MYVCVCICTRGVWSILNRKTKQKITPSQDLSGCCEHDTELLSRGNPRQACGWASACSPRPGSTPGPACRVVLGNAGRRSGEGHSGSWPLRSLKTTFHHALASGCYVLRWRSKKVQHLAAAAAAFLLGLPLRAYLLRGSNCIAGLWDGVERTHPCLSSPRSACKS